MRDDIDRGAVADFIQTNGLSYVRFAAHAGIPLSTLTAIMGAGRRPFPPTRDKIMTAIGRAPPPKAAPRHHAIVREHWAGKTSAEIGEMIGITAQGVRSIAKRLGLPGKRNDAISKAAE